MAILDLPEAFDTVDPSALLLKQTSQRVSIRGFLDTASLLFVVPGDSVLGPFLNKRIRY